MQVIVSGKQVDVGESLRDYIEEKTRAGVEKYIDRINTIKVVLSKEGYAFRVDISGNIGTHAGLTLKSRTEGTDPYATFDLAIEKVEKQLRRYKRQLTDHHNGRGDAPDMEAMESRHYVISTEEQEAEEPDNPLIIAENTTQIERLTVSDAVMRLDLGELPALLFINDANERLNVIYRRGDGNIAWVDPHTEQAGSAAA
jgi:ribosomal subunit interface protein